MLKIIGDKAQHIFLGDEMMEAASNNYKIFSYHIINNTLMVDRIAKMNFASNLKKIGFLGNITEEKGVLLFLDTIKKVNACNINVSWVLAGPIKDSKLKDKIIKSCSDARLSLSWLGPVYGKEKEAFFREIDLLLFPSLYKNEAQPLTIYEAMAQGIPVLATPKGSIPSQIDSKHCIISEDHFAKQASRMIKDWHNDTSAFNKERTAVLETFESSLDDCALSIKSLLESI
jgi:glycosyltransferase involved in cell wall biosynthesis